MFRVQYTVLGAFLAFNIFRYLHYRAALNAWFSYSKETTPGFSHRSLARRLKTSNPSVLKNIIEGRNRISLKRAAQLSEVMGLKGDSEDYFYAMIAYNHGTEESRPAEKAKMFAIRALVNPAISETQLVVLASPTHTAIRELVRCFPSKISPCWVAVHLTPPIEVQKAESVLADLLAVKAILKNEEQQWYVPEEETTIETGALTGGVALLYHQATMDLASKHLHGSDPYSNSVLNGGTLAIPSNRIDEFRTLLFQKLAEVFRETESWENPDQVLQVNLLAFPMSNPPSNNDQNSPSE